MRTQLYTKKWLRWLILSIWPQFFKKEKFFQFLPPKMTPVIFGHICFPDTFSTTALTFVGEAAAHLPLSIGNWQSQEKCQVGLVRFRWRPHWEQKSRRNNPRSATDSGFLVFILRGSEGITGFFMLMCARLWRLRLVAVSGPQFSHMLTCSPTQRFQYAAIS